MKRILSVGENRRVAQAMLDYGMLADGDRVLAAVSGGIDSLVLAWLLHYWQRKAPIAYEVEVVHIDMQPDDNGRHSNRAEQTAAQLAALGIACQILPAEQPVVLEEGADPAGLCHRCARNRRRQLFEQARQSDCGKLAFGHHRDDIVETFFINLTSGGNISTMRPKQELFSGRIALIRPLAYLEKEEIRAIGKRLGLEPVPATCPLAEQTRRKDIRDLLQHIYAQLPGSREQIFAALGNVRAEYLLLQETKRSCRPPLTA
ncbi:MAG: tRNA 2-thiocytidine biosynthesis protein TtcA [Candidatus Electronema aureum]|uniref:tRNA 2-thiocytidine biosynthesis protein TtcA n=1 Tax=Candidatus Electronema aureum TaxID=2005002 RepID=A0A521FZ91_9BACT|nr:MAG: tRNA 2-thiocytidine biosynthesis protein TtcA [Candidatus Electronema aureum]